MAEFVQCTLQSQTIWKVVLTYRMQVCVIFCAEYACIGSIMSMVRGSWICRTHLHLFPNQEMNRSVLGSHTFGDGGGTENASFLNFRWHLQITKIPLTKMIPWPLWRSNTWRFWIGLIVCTTAWTFSLAWASEANLSPNQSIRKVLDRCGLVQ